MGTTLNNVAVHPKLIQMKKKQKPIYAYILNPSSDSDSLRPFQCLFSFF